MSDSFVDISVNETGEWILAEYGKSYVLFDRNGRLRPRWQKAIRHEEYGYPHSYVFERDAAIGGGLGYFVIQLWNEISQPRDCQGIWVRHLDDAIQVVDDLMDGEY